MADRKISRFPFVEPEGGYPGSVEQQHSRGLVVRAILDVYQTEAPKILEHILADEHRIEHMQALTGACLSRLALFMKSIDGLEHHRRDVLFNEIANGILNWAGIVFWYGLIVGVESGKEAGRATAHMDDLLEGIDLGGLDHDLG